MDATTPDTDLCLLTVHAHPDDEASKGAGTVARYGDEGIRTVLVCCTGGEEGDVLNPAMDRPEVLDDLPAVRMRELEASVEILGFDELVMLGYRDSGMPESEANFHPDSFWAADLDEAVDRLVAVVRRVRPQVIVTYNDDQSGYPHPDHLRVHDVSVLAFDRAGDLSHRPDLGEPWQASKLYYSIWSRSRIEEIHAKMLEMGIESPFTPEWFERPSQDDRITSRVHIGEQWDRRRGALLAHATQVDPESAFWFGLPDEVARRIHPYDDYVLARSHVETDLPEDDLFAGLR